MRPAINQSIVFTYCDDLPAASRFLAEVMELELVVDQGPCHIYRLTETGFLGVCALPDRPRAQAGVTLSIVSDDVEGWHEFLVSKGVGFERAPAPSARFGITSALFVSPHGYRIEIQRFDDADWHRGPSERR